MFYVTVILIKLSAFVGLNSNNWNKATIASQTVWLFGILSAWWHKRLWSYSKKC